MAVRNPESLLELCASACSFDVCPKNPRNRGGDGAGDVALGILHSPEEGSKCFHTILKRREKTECRGKNPKARR